MGFFRSLILNLLVLWILSIKSLSDLSVIHMHHVTFCSISWCISFLIYFLYFFWFFTLIIIILVRINNKEIVFLLTKGINIRSLVFTANSLIFIYSWWWESRHIISINIFITFSTNFASKRIILLIIKVILIILLFETMIVNFIG